MANYGISDKGFKIKRLTEVQEGMRERAANIFADLVPPNEVVDTSASSLLGRLITLASVGNADLWELSQQVYLAFDPNSATGIALDNLVALGGIERFGASRGAAQAVFTGTNGTFIPQGSSVRATTSATSWSVIGGGVGLDPSKATGIQVGVGQLQPSTEYWISFTTDFSVAIATYTTGVAPTAEDVLQGLLSHIEVNLPTLEATIAGGLLNVSTPNIFQEGGWTTSDNLDILSVSKIGTLQADEVGRINQAPNTISIISTPVLGWDSVYNPVAAIPGRLAETDSELRLRFRNSKFQRASNTLESLYTAISSIDSVREVRIYENDSDMIDENGVPPHSFMPVVLGGDSGTIAQKIWDNKPLGIGSFGNTIVSITDSQFFTHAIGFERPIPVPIYISIALTITGEFPPDGVVQIKDQIVDYFSTLRIGDDVVYSRLYTPINSVAGHQVDLLEIGLSADALSPTNIIIPFNRIASIDPNNIVINI